MTMELFFLKSIFSLSSIMFLLVKSHFLLSLLFLEMMSMIMYFVFLSFFFTGSSSFLLIFLCMMVLEGVFGLSLLINNSRKMGGDFIFMK